MSISYVNAAAINTTGGANKPVDYPASTTAGNLLVMFVLNRLGSNTVTSGPSGWSTPSGNTVSGGAGTDGLDDEGTVRVTAYYKIADGTEGGTTVNISTSGSNTLAAHVLQYANATGSWDVACASGAQNTGGSTAYSVTMGADPGITSADWVIAGTCMNTDAYTFSAHGFSASGLTVGTQTERVDIGSTNGNDIRRVITEHQITSGTASAAGTFTSTASGSSTNAPAGATLVLRIREVSGGLTITSITPSQIDSGESFTITGAGFGATQGLSLVQIGGVTQTPTSWSDSSITCTATRGSQSMGNATLTIYKM